MKILVLGSEIPATPSMPGSPRLFSLCRYLSKHHRLTLVAFGQGSERHEAFLGDPMVAGVFQEVIALPEAPEAGWWGRQVHRVRQEANIVTRYRTPRYFADQRRRILEIAAAGDFDVVFADGLPVSQYVMDGGLGRPAVIDLHDCFTLLFSRTMKAEPRWLRKLALYAESRSIARLERALGRAFQAVITNSGVDEAFLRTLDPSANTLTIENGVDGDYFRPSEVKPDMSRLVFTGVMDYGPNEDAAVYFAESILPVIQERRPEVEFWVVGKDPTERVQALSRRPGVHVTGGVPDVRPHLEAAGVFVCPLRFGAGVKNKLLAALAMNRAVVATPLSMEGLELRDGEHLLLAEDPAGFAMKVASLIEDPTLAGRLGAAGRAAVTERYSWESSGRALEEKLAQAAAGAVLKVN